MTPSLIQALRARGIRVAVGRGASDAELAAFEARVGFTLPAPVAAFHRAFGYVATTRLRTLSIVPNDDVETIEEVAARLATDPRVRAAAGWLPLVDFGDALPLGSGLLLDREGALRFVALKDGGGDARAIARPFDEVVADHLRALLPVPWLEVIEAAVAIAGLEDGERELADDVVLAVPGVPGRYALAARDDGTWVARPLDAARALRVDGAVVDGEVVLRDGARLAFADVATLAFHVARAAISDACRTPCSSIRRIHVEPRHASQSGAASTVPAATSSSGSPRSLGSDSNTDTRIPAASATGAPSRSRHVSPCDRHRTSSHNPLKSPRSQIVIATAA